jgi:hypothetical protein
LTWLPRRFCAAWELVLLRRERCLLRERYEAYLVTLPEDEQRRIGAEMEAELAQASWAKVVE